MFDRVNARALYCYVAAIDVSRSKFADVKKSVEGMCF